MKEVALILLTRPRGYILNPLITKERGEKQGYLLPSFPIVFHDYNHRIYVEIRDWSLDDAWLLQVSEVMDIAESIEDPFETI